MHELWRSDGHWTLTCLVPGHPTPDPSYQLTVLDDEGTSILYRREDDGNMHELFINSQTGWTWRDATWTSFMRRL